MAESEKARELRHASTLAKLAKEERAEAGEYGCGGKVKMAKGGAVRGDGCATKGKTKGRIV